MDANIVAGGKLPLLQSGINRINASGGLVMLAHPAWSLNTPETIMSLHGLAAAEIYNSVSAAPFSGDRADSSSLLDVAAANGCLLNSVAADDSHYYRGEEGRAFIRLQADELSEQGVLTAIRQGTLHASCGPEIKVCGWRMARCVCSAARWSISCSSATCHGRRIAT